MQTRKKNYTELYNRVLKGEKVPCWTDYDWQHSGKKKDICRDICQCKKLKYGDIVFSARGIGYGGVESYMDLKDEEKLPYFIRFCEKYNIEYVV